MRLAPPVALSPEQNAALRHWANEPLSSARLAERARIVLLAAEGKDNLEVAALLSISPAKAARWRLRFVTKGLSGLEKDAPRPGRRPALTADQVTELIRLTTHEKPPDATRWTTRGMARHMGISDSTVLRIWRTHRLEPHRFQFFPPASAPSFARALEAIAGLYLHPPEHAIALRLSGEGPESPRTGFCSGAPAPDYWRHGAAALLAAIAAATTRLNHLPGQRQRCREWFGFLSRIDATTPPDRPIHLLASPSAITKHPKVKPWLREHPRVHLYRTPAGASWLGVAENLFLELTGRRLQWSVFPSVLDLLAALDAYLAPPLEQAAPFLWIAPALA